MEINVTNKKPHADNPLQVVEDLMKQSGIEVAPHMQLMRANDDEINAYISISELINHISSLPCVICPGIPEPRIEKSGDYGRKALYLDYN